MFKQGIPYSLKSSAKVKLGEKVFTLGFPLGSVLGKSIKLSEGTISALSGIQDNATLYQISNPLQPGNSGGPLFSNDGCLCGIVVSGLNAKTFYEYLDIIPQNVNFAIKSDYLLTLINMLPENNFIINRANNLVGKDFQEQIEALTPYVVNVYAE